MRVLLVDDEEQLTVAVRRGLEAEGFEVEVADNGDDGYELATKNAYDAIVLDIMLPGMNGYRVCKALRDAGVWTPILMLTAKEGDLDEAEALDTGADDFLKKPFSFVVLVARLRALLRRGRAEKPAVLVVGDLRLDPSSHTVWRGETEVELTPRQFSLLEFLMQHPGEVLSKQTILDNVWDVDFAGDPNIVEVYIGYLRKRIDAPFGRSAIRTIRLVGYRLEADGG